MRSGERIFSGVPDRRIGMEYRMITYQAKPERAAENEQLVRDVFEELGAAAPDGIRYAVLRLADDRFVHLVAVEKDGSALTSLAAFQRFLSGIDERRTDRSDNDLTVVGNYGMLAD